MKRKIFSIGLLVCLMIGIAGCKDPNLDTATKTTGKTTSYQVTKGDLLVGTTVDGKIELSFTSLDFETSGILKKLYVKKGQRVKKGQTLAKIDDTDLQQEYVLAKNKYDQAKASYKDALDQRSLNLLEQQIAVKRAKKEYNNNKSDSTLKDQYHLSLKKYNQFLNNNSGVTNAKLQLQQAKDDFAAAKENLSKAILKAPSSGKIVNINKKVGELVDGNVKGGFMDASSAFMVLCDSNTVEVTTSITETDIKNIALKNKISVSVAAAELDNLSGSITNISSISSSDSSGIVSYSVTGKLNESNELLMDGMNCVITILKKEVKDVLLVPDKAIYIEDGLQYVNIQGEADAVEKRQVTCGLSNGMQSEVQDGLTEGEVVIIGGKK